MKPRLLLLHGALGTHHQFDRLRPLLEEHFEIFDFNFEGHGGVSTHSDYSISLFASNTKDFLEEHRLDDILVFGYSMGGYVALHLEYQYPGAFQKIITLGTKFDWTPESASKEVRMLNPEVIEEKVPRFAQKLKEDHAPLDWKAVMLATGKMMIDLGNGDALNQEDFQRIKGKVHLGLGSEDTMVSVEETEQVMQWLPNAEMKILEGIPHPIEKADSAAVSNYILSAIVNEGL
ncbi:MAG: alpha/beta hydrolase [Flavobacteriaceae bacterium]|nr:alpha/beta hydrolase [Flavobacteriaceae bacterium]